MEGIWVAAIIVLLIILVAVHFAGKTVDSILAPLRKIFGEDMRDKEELYPAHAGSSPLLDHLNSHQDHPYNTNTMGCLDVNGTCSSTLQGYSGYSDPYVRDVGFSDYGTMANMDYEVGGRGGFAVAGSGYGGFPERNFVDYLHDTELDPSVKSNHRQYVRDISRFYTGAHFTTVADDNRDAFSTNFVGLRRPKHTPIGPDARQQQDVSEDVFKRNRRFLL